MAEALEFDAFAQRLLQLLDEGRFVATYKFAVMLGLLEVLVETAGKQGEAPQTVSTRELAGAVVEIYWPHTRPFEGEDVLRQNQTGQAEIVRLIGAFREKSVGDASAPLGQARSQAPAKFEALVRAVEWKLIEMPLGRLQLIGNQRDSFIYRLGWEQPPKQSAVKADGFDGRLWLQPRAGDHLLRSAPLLRPLVQRTWSLTVARFNGLPQPDLEEFLFGAKRISLTPVAPALRELAGGACFYCQKPVAEAGQIDHFVPWARHIDNGIHNLVFAHSKCNGEKSAFLAAESHVQRWLDRAQDPERALAQLADQKQWDAAPDRTLAAARAIYLRLPSEYKLWQLGKDFTPVKIDKLKGLFASS